MKEVDFTDSESGSYVGNQKRQAPLWRRWHWYKLPLFVLSLFLFITAITLMKDGSSALGPLVQEYLAVTNFADALGFGWLFSYVILSGSPVAGAALTLFDAGAIDELGSFAMITGSRLGGSFIVLFIGFVYVLRGRNRGTSLGMGLLSLNVAATVQLLALLFGIPMLTYGLFDSYQLKTGATLNSVTSAFVEPLSTAINSVLPEWGVFVVGLGVIMVSFNLFDRCLPEMTLRESGVGTISRLVYRPWVMFLLGGLVTLISMSVSISLSLLVPLSDRGFVRRENVVPYIMGANISTFIDTLFAAVLLDNSTAFTIVLVEMLALTIASVLILVVNYSAYERFMLWLVNWTTASTRNLSIFMVAIFVIPLVLLLF